MEKESVDMIKEISDIFKSLREKYEGTLESIEKESVTRVVTKKINELNITENKNDIIKFLVEMYFVGKYTKI